MKQRPMFWLGILVVLIPALGDGRALAQQQPDVEMRERDALAACDSGQVQKGIEVLARLWAQTLEPAYVYDQGRCYQKANLPKEARGRFQEFLRVAKDPKIAQAASTENKDELVGRAQQFVKELDAEIAARDREAPAPVLPTRLPQAPDPSADRVSDSRLVDASLTSEPSPAAGASPVYKRWWFWTALAAVAVGGIATAVVLSAGSDAPGAATTFGTRKATFQ